VNHGPQRYKRICVFVYKVTIKLNLLVSFKMLVELWQQPLLFLRIKENYAVYVRQSVNSGPWVFQSPRVYFIPLD
jgi:hypothetical protein